MFKLKEYVNCSRGKESSRPETVFADLSTGVSIEKTLTFTSLKNHFGASLSTNVMVNADVNMDPETTWENTILKICIECTNSKNTLRPPVVHELQLEHLGY